MAQAIFLKILVLALFLCPLCQTQTNESVSLLHDANQASTGTNEKSDSFPAGCSLYQNRNLLQCRNAGLTAIPQLKEEWNIFSVDLSSNNISSLQFGDGYKNVKSINLEQNNLTTITDEIILELQHIHFLTTVDQKQLTARDLSRSIGGNPLHCDCKLKWLRERLLGSNNQFPYVRHIQDLKCATPSSLQGRTLVTLSEEVLCGSKPEDRLLRSTTSVPNTEEEKLANSTPTAKLVDAEQKAMEKGRVAEIIGVTLGFAAVIVIMSVVFIVI